MIQWIVDGREECILVLLQQFREIQKNTSNSIYVPQSGFKRPVIRFGGEHSNVVALPPSLTMRSFSTRASQDIFVESSHWMGFLHTVLCLFVLPPKSSAVCCNRRLPIRSFWSFFPKTFDVSLLIVMHTIGVIHRNLFATARFKQCCAEYREPSKINACNIKYIDADALARSGRKREGAWKKTTNYIRWNVQILLEFPLKTCFNWAYRNRVNKRPGYHSEYYWMSNSG